MFFIPLANGLLLYFYLAECLGKESGTLRIIHKAKGMPATLATTMPMLNDINDVGNLGRVS